MKAVVLAGGEGTRLRPLTVGRPKPMVPILEKPVLEHVLALLVQSDVRDVYITVHYLASAIQDYFGDGSDFGLRIQYVTEPQPLGTAGAVKNAAAFLDETFLVVSGDALTDAPLQEAVALHQERGALATLVLTHVPNPREYGLVVSDASGRIRQFVEKPSWSEIYSDTVNTGIYVLEPEALRLIPANQPFDFSRDLFPMLLEEGTPLYGYVAGRVGAGSDRANCVYWCDVGSIPEYLQANADMLSGRLRLPLPGKEIVPGIWSLDGATIAEDAQLTGPILLGRDCRIGGGAVIHGPTVIGNYSVVGQRATVDRSVIWSNAHLGDGVSVSGAIVGKQCSLKAGAIVLEAAVVADNCTVGAGAIVQSGVKVWPDKEIEPGATVGESLIWGARGRRTLFTRSGVTGLANVEITPEFGAKLGAVYAALLPKGSSVTVNRDLSRAARMIKRAIISGLPSAGVDVVDIEAVPVPVARYETRTSGATGGIHVRLSPFLAGELDVKLFDWRGFNVDPSTERRIENAFFREDFRRVPLAEIGRIVEAVGVLERYSAAFLERVDGESLRRAGLHVVVDFAEGSSSHLFAGLLERLGVRRVVLNAATGERLGVRTLAQYHSDLAQLSTITTTVRANLGLTLNNDATRFTLVDERGQVLADFTALAAFAVLCLRAHRGGTIAVPVQAPSIFDEVVGKHGGRLIRTKHNTSALMAAAGDGVCLIGDGHGGIHFPELESGFDAMLAVTKLLGYLSAEKVGLSEVVAELPPYILVERDVPCPWDDKGRVMRALNDQASTSAAAQIDGVKFEGDGEWALVLPDPDHPTFQIFAEAESRERADALVDRYADLVASLRG